MEGVERRSFLMDERGARLHSPRTAAADLTPTTRAAKIVTAASAANSAGVRVMHVLRGATIALCAAAVVLSMRAAALRL
jgi:hypothetical protein